MTHPLVEELRKSHEEFQAKAKVAINVEFKAFFEKHPEVKSIVWTQYTPYFNDGDSCEFGVNELYFCGEPDGEEEDDDEYDDRSCIISELKSSNAFEQYDWKTRTTIPPARELTPEEASLIEDGRNLSSLVQGLDSFMENIFGDHVQVKASRTGFDIQEYSHD